MNINHYWKPPKLTEADIKVKHETYMDRHDKQVIAPLKPRVHDGK